MDEFNALRYIDIKYPDISRDVWETMLNYINSEEYENHCKKYKSFSKPIDEYYKRMGD